MFPIILQRIARACASLALAAAATAAFAHHSGAMFDHERTQRITGVITEFLWNNPHASFKLEVKAAGATPVVWAIEMNAPNNLVREGWKRTTLKTGDTVTVLVNPLRDGRPGGWYLGIRLADGTVLGRSAAELK
jgi:hypothetical protein